MSDYPALRSVDTAEALLSDLCQVKDDFHAVDSAVANHLRDGRERADHDQSATEYGLFGVSVGCLSGLAAAAAVTALTGFDTELTAVTSTVFEWADVFMIDGGASGLYIGVRRGRKRARAIVAAHAQRGDDFLIAGVAVELALGDLRTAPDGARRGRPGSAETLAEQSAQARRAFEHYASALRTLNEDDVSIRFPWSTRDIDVTEARELLAVTADAFLAQARFVGAEAEAGLLGRQPKALTTRSSVGGLDTVIRYATALQEDLAAAGRTLKAVDGTVRQAALAATDGTAGQTLRELADAVAEAYLRSGFLEADCASIESAASSVQSAYTRQQILDELRVPSSSRTVHKCFQAYASCVQVAATQLAAAADDNALREAGVSVRSVEQDVPRLKATVEAMTTAMDAELERAGQPT